MIRVKNVLFSAVYMFLLVACGGSSSGSDPAQLSRPVGITTSAGDESITLSWNSVSGATSYNLYWSETSGQGVTGAKISNVSSPYTHSALVNGTTYYYVITAVSSNTESTASDKTSATPAIPAPDAPSIQSADPDDQQVLLSWNTVSGATSYNLYWSTSSGDAASGTQITDVTSPFPHTGLTNGVTYYYVLTAVSAAGESESSAEVSATPFMPPYATEQYPYHLGTAPITAYDESIPENDIRDFHYTLAVTPGATYMFSLNNVVDGANLYVFNDDSWDEFGLQVACSDSSYPNTKYPVKCVAVAPVSGLFYLRIGATTDYAEAVTLQVDEIVTEGAIGAAIDLGTAPISNSFGTVLEAGESVYQVTVTPGQFYRVSLTDWRDSGASLSRLNLNVFDDEYTDIFGPNKLCSDYGGNSSVTHQHRIRTIHCLAKPTDTYISIVTGETQYGDGATYHISVEPALTEGTNVAPYNISADAFVYHGEVTHDPASPVYGYSYYRLSVTPNTSYLVDLRGMHEELDMSITQSDFSTVTCNSAESNLVDESCVTSSDASGFIYVLVKSPSDVTDTFILSALPAPVGATSPARYPDEGLPGVPTVLSTPLSDRLSTVGAGISYYSLAVTADTQMEVSVTDMNVDVDVFIYSDASYSNRLCASTNFYTEDDSCTLTVPSGVDTLYIQINGQYTTNNGSWSSGTEEDVGAMFRLTATTL